MRIHEEIDKKIDLSKPLMPQVEKLTREEFLFYVKRPRHLDDYDSWQLEESYWWDFFQSRIARNLYLNLTILESLALYWLYSLRYDEQYPVVVKVLVFCFGLFVVWPAVEYYSHRFDLHGEENLPDDPTGKVQSKLFGLHINHHVYMKAKYRICLSLHYSLIRMAILYPALSLLIGATITKSFLAGLLHGMNIYDFLHYSYHHYDLKFPSTFL